MKVNTTEWQETGLSHAKKNAISCNPTRSSRQILEITGKRSDYIPWCLAIGATTMMCVDIYHSAGNFMEFGMGAFFMYMIAFSWSAHARRSIKLARKGEVYTGVVLKSVGGKISKFQVETITGKTWLSPSNSFSPEKDEVIPVFYLKDCSDVGACLEDGFAVKVQGRILVMLGYIVLGCAVGGVLGVLGKCVSMLK